VRLAALDLGGDLRVDLGGIGPESVISENLGFHLKFMSFLLFTEMSPFYVNSVTLAI